MARGLQANRVVCMAHPRRVAKVAKQIEREIGNMFLFDRRLQEAVCPERRYGVDNAVSGLASVTEVVLSGDLQVAKVYISVFSDDFGKAVALSNLKKLEGYVRYNIGQQMRLRLVPEIRFIEDESLEKSLQVLKLLDQIKAEREGGPAMPRPPVAIKGERDFEEDEDEDEDEDDEGIVDISTSADEDIEAAFAVCFLHHLPSYIHTHSIPPAHFLFPSHSYYYTRCTGHGAHSGRQQPLHIGTRLKGSTGHSQALPQGPCVPQSALPQSQVPAAEPRPRGLHGGKVRNGADRGTGGKAGAGRQVAIR